MADLPVALTFDLDPDYFDESVGPTEGRTRISWRCISEGVGIVRERICQTAADYGLEAAPTWFVRVDNQVADLYGRPAHLLDAYGEVFEGLTGVGDEIAWHPHLYRLTEAGWSQETDPAALEDAMAAALMDMRAFGYSPRCGRIGEAYGSTGTMSAYDKLGLGFDSTAMPGRRRVDGERMLDWEPTPQDAYRPSLADYRVPGAPAHEVIEIPFSMLQSKATYDPESFSRYFDLSFRNEAMRDGVDAMVREAPYIVSVTHPSAVISDFAPPGGHGLVAFDPAAISQNLAKLIEAARTAGRHVRFVSISELGEEVRRRLDDAG